MCRLTPQGRRARKTVEYAIAIVTSVKKRRKPKAAPDPKTGQLGLATEQDQKDFSLPECNLMMTDKLLLAIATRW